MPLTSSYTMFGNEVVGQTRSGNEHDYVRDAIGSTVALLDSGGLIADTWSYWPYGEVRLSTGAGITPLKFGGTRDYITIELSSLIYVRARHFDSFTGSWTTVDPWWPFDAAYAYVGGQPLRYLDPSGEGLGQLFASCLVEGLGGLGSSFYNYLNYGEDFDWGTVGCNLGPPCAGSLIAAGILIGIPESGPIAGCLASAAGGLADSLLTLMFCTPSDPCRPVNSMLCTLFDMLVNAGMGCISGALTPEGAPVINELVDMFLQAVANFAQSQGVSGCQAHPGDPSGSGLVPF